MSKLIDELRERIEQNYEDFKAELLTHDKETIIGMARTIAAMEDVVFYMDIHDWVDESEAAYLLDFTEPLKLIADAWEEQLDDGDCHFRTVLKSVLNDEENEERYMTLALESELREKYGYDVSITGALLMELVEAGNRYLELRGVYECLGADAWDED